MTAITTVAELDALPVGASVVDGDGDTWTHRVDGWVFRGKSGHEGALRYLAGEVLAFGPVRLVYELRSTRCSGSDACVNTTPLPVGAWWRCADCGGTDTTRGN